MLGDSSRRGVVLSTTSTVVVLAVLVGIFLLAPGSAQVRHTFFNPADMWRSFVGDPKAGYYSVGEALWLNIRMFIAAEVLILIFALAVAVVRQSTGPVLLPLRVAATVYVDVARGVPLILIIFALGYGLPALQLTVISDQSAAVYGVAALVLSYSAYVAEVYRAGINSVHRSQVAAARSLGLSQWSSMRYVILPQAIRNIIPPLLNDFISLQKDTAQVGLLGAIEANKAAEIYSSTVFNYSSYVVAAILFLALTIPLARFTDHLIRRDQARRLAGAGQLWAERARFPFPVRRPGQHPARGGRERGAAAHRHRVPVVQPVPAHDRGTERDASADEGARPVPGRGGVAGG
jgi:polar amino acid transport system permease protein